MYDVRTVYSLAYLYYKTRDYLKICVYQVKFSVPSNVYF